MKLQHYIHSWRGIEFSDLAIVRRPGSPADKNFYDVFYRALKERAPDENSSWHASKRALGEWIEQNLLRPLGKPRILSIGVGEAIPERGWLRRGYAVTLNECQDNTLAAVKAEFPGAPVLIADAHQLKPEAPCQAVTILTVDYALDDRQLTELFSNMAAALTPDGVLINYTANMLSVEQLLKEVVKALIGRRYGKGSVLWGWYRSPGAIRSIAAAAGFQLKDQYMARDDGYVLRPKWLWPFMPARNQSMIMVFGRHFEK